MANEKTNAVNEALRLPLAGEFERRLTQALENECDVVLAMIDLDSFLAVNEDFGYREGDRVLIETGEYLRGALAGRCELYRYGGDQFGALFLGGEEKEDVFLLMEETRRGYNVALPDGKRQTLSVGIAAAFDDAGSYQELVRKAEGAMVRGKMNGRDRVCLSRDEKMITKTSHYTQEQLKRLTKASKREGIGEAILLREALDALLKKYDV